MNLIKFSELLGAFTGVTAALMIALHIDMEVESFVLYILSDIAWIYVAIKKDMKELLLMSAVFALIGVIGIYNWI